MTRILAIVVVCALLIAACGDDDDSDAEQPSVTATSTTDSSPVETASETGSPSPMPTDTVTQEPTNSPTVVDEGETEATAQDISERLQVLAGDIGERPAGSSQEQAAADYIQEQLESFGYQVEQQTFEVSAFLDDRSRVSAEGEDYQAFAMQGSELGEVEGQLVAAGLGAPGDFPREVAGNIAVIERGEITFGEKVGNAQDAGARGVIMFNNEPGPLFGDLGGGASVPVVGVSGLDGGALLDAIDAGASARVIVEGSEASESQNVIGRMDDSPCRFIVGGHYDSVPFAPGGQDNGSGTTAVLETAETLAASGGADGVCFIAFGSEEIGLLGSIHFIEQLDEEEADSIEAVFNLDTVGVGDDLRVEGAQSMEDLILAAGQQQGVNIERGQLGFAASSDHAPFLSAGIPAVIVFTADVGPIHTPEDTIAIVEPDTLVQAVNLVIAAITELR